MFSNRVQMFCACGHEWKVAMPKLKPGFKEVWVQCNRCPKCRKGKKPEPEDEDDDD